MPAPLPELQDRLELRQLVEAYAHGADRREAEAMALLFTEDGRLVIYAGEPGASPPTAQRTGRAEIGAAMTRLGRYVSTTHLLGQQSVVLDGDRATGETYCLAHHITDRDGQRSIYIMSIRYLDQYARVDGTWLIAERVLAVDWTETRPMS